MFSLSSPPHRPLGTGLCRLPRICHAGDFGGDEDGDVLVLAAGREKRIISQTNPNGPVYSSPVVANGTLYVASTTHLYAIRAGAAEPSAVK